MNPFSEESLERFVLAQELDYEQALAEIRAGRKHTHWIWFIFPQLKGLGSSHMANTYGIQNAAEAAAYLEHPILGARLSECVNAMLTHSGRSAVQILGEIDAMKFRSCLTLFSAVSGPNSMFAKALDTFYSGQGDEKSIQLLRSTTGDA